MTQHRYPQRHRIEYTFDCIACSKRKSIFVIRVNHHGGSYSKVVRHREDIERRCNSCVMAAVVRKQAS